MIFGGKQEWLQPESMFMERSVALEVGDAEAEPWNRVRN